MIGNVWLRSQPDEDAERLGLILEIGQMIEVLATTNDWYQVRWSPQGDAQVIGWVPARWVGMVDQLSSFTPTPFAEQP
jgi:uncharacterized protein YgiM (DUF1202 family)